MKLLAFLEGRPVVTSVVSAGLISLVIPGAFSLGILFSNVNDNANTLKSIERNLVTIAEDQRTNHKLLAEKIARIEGEILVLKVNVDATWEKSMDLQTADRSDKHHAELVKIVEDLNKIKTRF